jgi:hypothetical protein
LRFQWSTAAISKVIHPFDYDLADNMQPTSTPTNAKKHVSISTAPANDSAGISGYMANCKVFEVFKVQTHSKNFWARQRETGAPGSTQPYVKKNRRVRFSASHGAVI